MKLREVFKVLEYFLNVIGRLKFQQGGIVRLNVMNCYPHPVKWIDAADSNNKSRILADNTLPVR